MDATTETTTLLEKKTHDPARYGERWAHRLDIRWDQVCFRHAAAGSYRNPQTPGAVRAWAGYLKTLARYEAERAQALAADEETIEEVTMETEKVDYLEEAKVLFDMAVNKDADDNRARLQREWATSYALISIAESLAKLAGLDEVRRLAEEMGSLKKRIEKLESELEHTQDILGAVQERAATYRRQPNVWGDVDPELGF